MAGFKLKRLYRVVEDGLTDLDDILRERLVKLKQERDRAKAALDRIHVAKCRSTEIAPEMIERFGRLMRENVATDEIPFRKAWLQSIVDQVEVGTDVIRIIGGKANLDAPVAEAGSTAVPGVHSSVRKWRTRHDSNV